MIRVERELRSLALAVCALGVASCGGGGGGGTPPVAPSATPRTTATPSAAPTATPTPAPTPTPTPSGPTPTPSPAPNTQPIVVANEGGADVLIFAPAAGGNASPQSSIAGSNTLLTAPAALAAQSSGTISTLNAGSNEVLSFAATGNVAPSQTVVDTNPGIASYGLALTALPSFALYLSSKATAEIDVYASASANGPPNATISGNLTTLVNPTGMVADRAGNLYVIDGAAIKVFANAAAGGNIAPAVISGGATTLNAPAGIGVDGRGDILVADGAAVKIFAAGSSGDVSPSTVISGAATGLQNATGVTVDGTGAIWVCDSGTNALYRFKPGASGNVAPIVVISGGNTTLNSPSAIVLEPVI